MCSITGFGCAFAVRIHGIEGWRWDAAGRGARATTRAIVIGDAVARVTDDAYAPNYARSPSPRCTYARTRHRRLTAPVGAYRDGADIGHWELGIAIANTLNVQIHMCVSSV